MVEKTMAKSENVVRADEVIGVKVTNNQKENLGKIYQIVLDKLTGQTVYLILETGTFLGMGGKLLALPWNAISYDPEEEAFLLNISKDKIKDAPGFDKDNWPNITDESWNQSIFRFYGTKSYWD